MNPEILTAQPEAYAIRNTSPLFHLWPWAKGPLWKLAKPWKFRAYNYERERWEDYTIPAGYEYDKASIPSVLWGPPFYFTPDGLHSVAALEHDFLCDVFAGGSEWLKNAMGADYPEALKPRSIHGHFYHRMLAYGVPPWQARVFWQAVVEFGPGGKWLIRRLWNNE